MNRRLQLEAEGFIKTFYTRNSVPNCLTTLGNKKEIRLCRNAINLEMAKPNPDFLLVSDLAGSADDAEGIIAELIHES